MRAPGLGRAMGSLAREQDWYHHDTRPSTRLRSTRIDVPSSHGRAPTGPARPFPWIEIDPKMSGRPDIGAMLTEMNVRAAVVACFHDERQLLDRRGRSEVWDAQLLRRRANAYAQELLRSRRRRRGDLREPALATTDHEERRRWTRDEHHVLRWRIQWARSVDGEPVDLVDRDPRGERPGEQRQQRACPLARPKRGDVEDARDVRRLRRVQVVAPRARPRLSRILR